VTALQTVDGALLIYHHTPEENAPAIMEHVESFPRYSRLPVFAVNTDRGFPRALAKRRFRALILHYGLFGGDHYWLSDRYLRFIEAHRDYHTVAFFQDEHRFCRRRFEFLKRYHVDAVYSLLEPEHHRTVYGGHAGIADTHHTLPGYVSEAMVDAATRFGVPDVERAVDIGYRARRLAFFQGRGAQEKHEIGDRFLARATHLGLCLDIDTRETSRIYGDAWYRFVANCRGMLGVEAGTSIFDLDDSARERTDDLLAVEPDLPFAEVERRMLHAYEGRIPYRTISPRHFEAAVFRVVQILHPGHYSGVMEPDVHYLALEKDFSNFDDVMARFSDAGERRRITDRTYHDLIASGRYSYDRFMAGIDDHFEGVGVTTTLPVREHRAIRRDIRRGAGFGRVRTHPRWFVKNAVLPGRGSVAARWRTIHRALRAGP
jgi:hypothetical protein